MKQYLDLIRDIMAHGTERKDRTGVGTISVFGRQIRFDMRNGFPAVTTKALAWRSVISELLWFLEGSASEHRLAEIKNDNKPYAELSEKERRTIWTANYEKQGRDLGYQDGFLGNIYGHQWANLFVIDYSTLKIHNKQKEQPDNYEYPKFEQKTIQYNNDLAGKIFTSKKGYKCVVFDVKQSGHTGVHSKYLVQFLNTGSIKELRRNQLTSGDFVDNYEKNVFGVGCTGDEITKINGQHTKEYILWHSMMQRCYSPKNSHYKSYGGRGVTVCKRWHYFSNFKNDIQNLPFYTEWKKGLKYELDKDIKGGKVYSPETCVFTPSECNRILSKINTKMLVYQGRIYPSLRYLQEDYPYFTRKKVNDILNGIYQNEQDHDLSKLKLKENEFVSFEYKHINQIANAINMIKSDPWSRRIVANAWNVYDLNDMALMPCHYAFQFYVSGENGEYLSLMWNQRSVDVCCGLCFNIASYGLLLHIIAKITNKIPLELIGNLGDTHIYLNHLDGAIEQLSREPKKLPELILPEKADYSDINGFLKSVKTSDFKLKDYEHYPAIKFEMAV